MKTTRGDAQIESMRAELTELRQLLMAKNSGSLSAIWDVSTDGSPLLCANSW